MKKYKTLFFVSFISLLILTTNKPFAMTNPWINCKDDIYCGAKKAGFNFPLMVQNYSVRAMKDMMEITYPLNKKRTLTVRKAQSFDGKEDENGIKDISGVYETYPVNKNLTLKNGVIFKVRGEKNKFYVANFAAETGYYSFYSKQGFNKKDIEKFYKLLADAEAPRVGYDEEDEFAAKKNSDEIIDPIYTQDCFPKTLQKRGVTKNCFEKANFGNDKFCSASEIKMIKKYYKIGQDKDPLNDGSGNFCAD